MREPKRSQQRPLIDITKVGNQLKNPTDSSLESCIADLESELKDLREEHEHLQSKYDKLKEEYRDLQNSYEDLDGKYDNLESERFSLEEENEKLSHSVAAYNFLNYLLKEQFYTTRTYDTLEKVLDKAEFVLRYGEFR